jgi:hypothetical protein
MTTTTPTSEASELTPGSDAVSGGTFTRTNFADGLFLRAEHLQRIEDYASNLAAAAGAGVGVGVVHGYTCTLSADGGEVEVTKGLAFASGQPLQCSRGLSLPLAGVQPQTADDFWVVEIAPAAWLYGNEPVYGGLCDDPCGNGSGISPYESEGVRLQLRRDHIDGFGDVPKLRRRNWLASEYFERERRRGGDDAGAGNAPWLLPTVTNEAIAQITGHEWSGGTAPYDGATVTLGALWKDGEVWSIDIWTARRDLGDPLPAVNWQWRLGMRPRNVFLAQVLQFEAELANSSFGAPRQESDFEKKIREELTAARAAVGKWRSDKREDVIQPLAAALGLMETEQGASLPAAGFGELPSAGYLPLRFASVEEAENSVLALFGDQVDVRVRSCRADYVAHAVEEAQHMDRIPLVPERAAGIAKVDLLVTLEPPDLAVTRTDGYPWSAFVRRREDAPPDAAAKFDEVDVWLRVVDGPKAVKPTVTDLRTSVPDTWPQGGAQHIGTLELPHNEWGESMDQADVYVNVLRAIVGTGLLAVVGVARTDNRQPLAAARAGMLVARPDPAPDGPVQLADTYVVTNAKVKREAIFVLTPIVVG